MKTVATALLVGALFGVSPALAQQDVFTGADADANGSLTKEELATVAPETSDEDYAAVDLNGDGSLQYDEFEIGVEEGFVVIQ